MKIQNLVQDKNVIIMAMLQMAAIYKWKNCLPSPPLIFFVTARLNQTN